MSSLDSFLQKFGSALPTSLPNTSELDLKDYTSQTHGGSLESFVNRFTGMVDESYWFYKDTIQLKFNKSEHRYYRVGDLGQLIPLEGVTTVVHILDKSNALVPWCAKVVTEKLLRLVPTELIDGIIRIKPLSLEQFSTIVTEAKSAHKDTLEDAADVGSMAHNWLEYYIKAILAKDEAQQKTLLERKCGDERATNCVNAALDWMAKHNVRWIETERKIYSREHGYAGTMDGLCIVDSCNDPTCCPHQFQDRLSVADWKSSNYLYLEYLLQTAAYEGAYEEEFGVDIKDRWILRLGKEDGTFAAWHCTEEDFPADYEAFLICLKLNRTLDQIEERMKVQKKLIRALKKEAKSKAKQIAKEQEKLKKALEKAEKKKLEKEEKEKIKAEAKKRREEEKAAKKAGKVTANTKTRNVPVLSGESVLPSSSQLLLSEGERRARLAMAEITRGKIGTRNMESNAEQLTGSSTETYRDDKTSVEPTLSVDTNRPVVGQSEGDRLSPQLTKFFEEESEIKRSLIPEE